MRKDDPENRCKIDPTDTWVFNKFSRQQSTDNWRNDRSKPAHSNSVRSGKHQRIYPRSFFGTLPVRSQPSHHVNRTGRREVIPGRVSVHLTFTPHIISLLFNTTTKALGPRRLDGGSQSPIPSFAQLWKFGFWMAISVMTEDTTGLFPSYMLSSNIYAAH